MNINSDKGFARKLDEYAVRLKKIKGEVVNS